MIRLRWKSWSNIGKISSTSHLISFASSSHRSHPISVKSIQRFLVQVNTFYYLNVFWHNYLLYLHYLTHEDQNWFHLKTWKNCPVCWLHYLEFLIIDQFLKFTLQGWNPTSSIKKKYQKFFAFFPHSLCNHSSYQMKNRCVTETDFIFQFFSDYLKIWLNTRQLVYLHLISGGSHTHLIHSFP